MPTEKITFVIDNLKTGGAQKVAKLLASHWQSIGIEVQFLLLESLPKFLPLKILALRKALTHETKIVTFLDQVNLLTLLVAPAAATVIVSERAHPEFSSLMTSYPFFKPAWRLLRKLLYPKASFVVVQTEEIKTYFEVQKINSVVIPNPASSTPSSKPKEYGAVSTLVTAGRNSVQKNFPRFIRLFASLKKDFPSLKAKILLPEGETDHSLPDGIEVISGCTDISAHLGADSIFILSSDYEGFPNVLLEAFAAHTLVVSMDIPSGPAEILANGEFGFLAKNDAELLKITTQALTLSPDKRKELTTAAYNSLTRYDPEKIYSLWDNLLGVHSKR